MGERKILMYDPFRDITTVVINLQRRSDRLAQFREEAQKHFIEHYLYEGIDNKENPNKGFSDTYRSVLSDYSGEDILILEDDVIFEDEAAFKFYDAIHEMPTSFDMLYLGCNPHGPIEPIGKHVAKIDRAFTTHAIYWSRKGIDKVLSEYTYETKGVFDGWLDHVGPEFESYIVTPMIAYQRDSYSDLQHREMSYRKVMDLSYKQCIRRILIEN